MIAAGFDIGINGAVGLVSVVDGAPPTFITVFDLPVVGTKSKARVDPHALTGFLRASPIDVAVVEATQAFPAQGRSSIFCFGRTTGAIEVIIALAGIPIEIVSPGRWKRDLRLSSAKEDARALALRLYPSAAEHLRRVKDHSRSEALLLAHWLVARNVGASHA